MVFVISPNVFIIQTNLFLYKEFRGYWFCVIVWRYEENISSIFDKGNWKNNRQKLIGANFLVNFIINFHVHVLGIGTSWKIPLKYSDLDRCQLSTFKWWNKNLLPSQNGINSKCLDLEYFLTFLACFYIPNVFS